MSDALGREVDGLLVVERDGWIDHRRGYAHNQTQVKSCGLCMDELFAIRDALARRAEGLQKAVDLLHDGMLERRQSAFGLYQRCRDCKLHNDRHMPTCVVTLAEAALRDTPPATGGDYDAWAATQSPFACDSATGGGEGEGHG